MHVEVVNPVFQTALFVILLAVAIVLTARKDPKPHDMSHSHTNELKGIAILMVIFSHVGYFLFADHRFLYPLSVTGGVGGNLFLFLSGFGLASSSIKSKIQILPFYFKRLKNIFLPLWLVLTLILVLDLLLLGKTYDLKTIVESFLGFFPTSDIDTSLNSPLWYFTLVFFYYLIFPLICWKKMPLLSAAAVSLLGFFLFRLNLPVSKDVLKLYQLHFLAFPFGMAFAWFYRKVPDVNPKSPFVKYALIILLSVLFGYTAIHSGVGEKIITEQLISLVTMSSLVGIVLLKSIRSNLLIILGKYSYGIYLIHWPLMYRYDIIFKHLPAFLATSIYIAVFIGLGFLLNKLTGLLFEKIPILK